ncbi:MAG: hypothetical protein HUU07_05380 [Candidatus Brocadia sinica]|nr:hypothetical protein [Candidatus Brocadia sinica]
MKLNFLIPLPIIILFTFHTAIGERITIEIKNKLPWEILHAFHAMIHPFQKESAIFSSETPPGLATSGKLNGIPSMHVSWTKVLI